MLMLSKGANLSKLQQVSTGKEFDWGTSLVVDFEFDDRVDRLKLLQGMSPQTLIKELERFCAWLEDRESRVEIESGEEFG